jgi:hypothetical protein
VAKLWDALNPNGHAAQTTDALFDIPFHPITTIQNVAQGVKNTFANLGAGLGSGNYEKVGEAAFGVAQMLLPELRLGKLAEIGEATVLADEAAAAANSIIKAGCFVAGTLISTEDGLEPIEKIEVGTKIWSFDESTGKAELKEVVRTFERLADSLVKLDVGSETIEATSEHPFSVGDPIKALSGQTQLVKKTDRIAEKIRVYNFEVADFHAYFVSQAQMLVHNSSVLPISVDEALSRAEQFMEPGVPIRTVDGPTGVQFIQTFQDASGQTITRRVGFDLDPASPHVQQMGPHLNLQTQVDGVVQRTGPLADPHIPIDPATVVPGDYRR